MSAASRVITAQVRDHGRIQERRAQIAPATAEVFRKGLHTPAIRDVAGAPGLTQGAPHNYIRFKDDILYPVHQDLTARYAAGGESERRADIALICQETHALGREASRAALAQPGASIAMFGELVEAARRHGMALDGAPRLAADIVTYLPVMLSLRRWRLRHAADGPDAEAELVAFLLRGLGCPAEIAHGA